MEFKFRKKTKSEWAVLFILVMPFLFPLLIEILRMPDAITYSLDIVWIGLLLSMINKKNQLMTPAVRKLMAISAIFFAFTLVGFLLNFQSLLYYFWGLRNNGRFFVYFFACVFFVKAESTEYYLKFLDKLFWINVPIMLYQFFVLRIEQDHLGGVFGTGKGCNGYTNILLIIVVTKALIYCLYNKEALILCLIKCALAILLAAISELKAFYIEFVIIVALVMCFAKTSYKKFWISVGAVFGVVMGIRLIGMFFPNFANWFTLERIWRTATSETGYTASNDMNRLTAVSIAMEKFLPSFHQKLFGLGLGNCDYASYDFLITPFYRSYGALNYMIFSSAFLVLETGLIGMGLYIYFFVQLFLTTWKMSKDEKYNKAHCQLSMICSVMCGFLFILNTSLRVESAFLMFFVLALPFTGRRTGENTLKENNEALSEGELNEH